MPKVRVGLVGYGTIGKRVVEAVNKQPDMQVVGVVKTKPDFFAQILLSKGFELYAASRESFESMSKAGLEVKGVLEELLTKCDVVVDCTPEGTGAKNKPLYERARVKAIFQGGEKRDVAEASFVAEVNYQEALDKTFVRVVSCNTTGLSRTLGRLNAEFEIKKVRATIIRRGADPVETKRGPINALIPNPPHIPSHHGPDVQTVIHDLPIVTSAVIAPTTLMHLHVVNVEFAQKVTKDGVIDALSRSKRIRFVDSSNGFDSTASIIEFARDLGRARGDVPEVVVWRDSLTVMDNELYYMQAVHQESIVVPENVDAIRAVTGLEREAARSISLTNKTLDLE
ncbi:type II glyceraldehyde-3-phosphate dehydrogenase [Candidatus Marsarchaeota G2 archaeon ECH_B_SAG-G16]|jgi:glyceraldehyde-3-phosphate dehydrogenase, type II|uniref:Glyceraldehyde-3-phosphate dehydrogenase n=1 Tax=Candidatus Marsarchaeota G2 archaeon ECH_B_SAG-G16 TaxID=1978167 RepID=A0A2R6BZE2_9ARCH|nr:MAG: type II glyceraldehyde-3-phosphate dehydrogenase [Candidatus Marsarchaeota G2 archaeon ECH_B_SAG-G16]